VEYREALKRAAAECGVEPEYIDTWGRRHEPSEPALRAILASLGVPVESAEAIERYLETRAEAEWSRPLDPAIVVREDADSIPLRVSQAAAGSSVKLEIEWEGGELQHLWFWLPERPILRQRKFADREFLEKSLPLPKPLRLGYHRLRIYWVREPSLEQFGEARFIVGPERAYARKGRTAGVAISLFGLRSARNWGVGDTTDLKALIDALAPAGAAFVALNPLHAIANRQPYNTSPYLPQNSMYRNFLYLDVERVPGYLGDASLPAGIEAEIEALRGGEFVEYERAAQLKLQALGAAFQHFLDSGGSPDFDAFAESEGAALDSYAIYCALDEEMHRRDPNVWIWPQWPEEYRDPHSQAVEDFARERRARVQFFKFLQWQLDRQFAEAQAHALERGMSIGLYHDMALATDRFGGDLWAYREFFVPGCRVGAPPDNFAPNGQDWGFPPPSRDAHRSNGYELFAQTVRRCARHGGALRIDHVMRFFRLYWIPENLTAAEGAYVRDRAEDLLTVLALESVRQRFLVIGEDLGTVERGVRQRLAQAAMMGYRVLWFERNTDGGFCSQTDYAEHAAVSTTTHDLPTLAGFFSGRDIEARRAAGLIDDAAFHQQSAERDRDIERLRQALAAAGFADDALGFVLATPCELAIVNQEDLTGETDQQNLPASTWQYPNWRRKMRVAVEDLTGLANALRQKIDLSGR
jgi:4-alpha-glucanotransferase